MAPQIILGLGTGWCGLDLLQQILSQQPDTNFTLNQAPLLPWRIPSTGSPIGERFARWKSSQPRKIQRIGDASWFYLPHIEEAIRFEPNLKCVCLQRPEDEIVITSTIGLQSNRKGTIDHWVETPIPGREHDFLVSHSFPKYAEPTREAGIRRYWKEYAQVAEKLAAKFPENFRVFDTLELTRESGVRNVLDFCGIPRHQQVLCCGKPAHIPTSLPEFPPAPAVDPLDPKRCVVLVPFQSSILHECDTALRKLEQQGYTVRRIPGISAIDQGRNQMATEALISGFEETLWIDSDIVFQVEDVMRLRQHQLPIMAGIYPQKGKRALACMPYPNTPELQFGSQGRLVELLYVGFGFVLVRREAYQAIMNHHQLPICNDLFQRPMIPFFQPTLAKLHEANWYLSEDYSFCQRARESGLKIVADTRVRLWHIGSYRYGWEDAGREPQRATDFTLKFGDVHLE